MWSIQLLIKETNQYGPQYAFKMSMFMCPAVHMSTRSLLRSSSTHKPSDPPLRVELNFFTNLQLGLSWPTRARPAKAEAGEDEADESEAGEG